MSLLGGGVFSLLYANDHGNLWLDLHSNCSDPIFRHRESEFCDDLRRLASTEWASGVSLANLCITVN